MVLIKIINLIYSINLDVDTAKKIMYGEPI